MASFSSLSRSVLLNVGLELLSVDAEGVYTSLQSASQLSKALRQLYLPLLWRSQKLQLHCVCECDEHVQRFLELAQSFPVSGHMLAKQAHLALMDGEDAVQSAVAAFCHLWRRLNGRLADSLTVMARDWNDKVWPNLLSGLACMPEPACVFESQLSAACQRSETLQILSLRDLHLVNDRGLSLVASLTTLPNLKLLHLDNCHIGSSAYEATAVTRPMFRSLKVLSILSPQQPLTCINELLLAARWSLRSLIMDSDASKGQKSIELFLPALAALKELSLLELRGIFASADYLDTFGELRDVHMADLWPRSAENAVELLDNLYTAITNAGDCRTRVFRDLFRINLMLEDGDNREVKQKLKRVNRQLARSHSTAVKVSAEEAEAREGVFTTFQTVAHSAWLEEQLLDVIAMEEQEAIDQKEQSESSPAPRTMKVD